MEKFARDDNIDQMNAQKRRMKQLDHKYGMVWYHMICTWILISIYLSIDKMSCALPDIPDQTIRHQPDFYRRAVEELIDERRRRHEFEKVAERKQRENESVCIVFLISDHLLDYYRPLNISS